MNGRRLAALALSLGGLVTAAVAEEPRFPVRQVLPGAPVPLPGAAPRSVVDRVDNAWTRAQIKEDIEEGYALDALQNGLPPSDGTLPQEQPPSRPLAVPGVPEILPRQPSPVVPANVAPADGQGVAPLPPARPLAVPGVPEILPRQPAAIVPADVGPRMQPALGGVEEPDDVPPVTQAPVETEEAPAAAVATAPGTAPEPVAAPVASETPAPAVSAAPAGETSGTPAAGDATTEAPSENAPPQATATAQTPDAPPAEPEAVSATAPAATAAETATTGTTSPAEPGATAADAADTAAGATDSPVAADAAPSVPPAAPAEKPDAAPAVAAKPGEADTTDVTERPAAAEAADEVPAVAGAPQSDTNAAIAPPISAEDRRDSPSPPAASTAAADAAAAAAAQEAADTPVRLVRTLQLLQDQIAAGSTTALKGQRALLTRIEKRFAAEGPQTWQVPANAHALVTFVLSGGNPAPLRDVLGRTPIPPIDEKLMRGVLAYVDGRESEAADFLAHVDPLKVPPSMGAQVALAKAALSVRDNTSRAIGLLDTARLLAPGTLAEEAALRREIFVVSQIGDVQKFEVLATQYLMRFRHSVYAGNFRQRFAAALTRMDFIDDPAQFLRLDSMISDLDLESRREIYLLVARAAVNRGLTNASTLAAERALELAEDGSVEAARARLYRAAALVVTPQGLASGMEDLAAINPAILPPDDAALHQAASSTARLILTAPDLPDIDAPVRAARPLPSDEPLSEVAVRARDALAAVDELMNRSSR